MSRASIRVWLTSSYSSILSSSVLTFASCVARPEGAAMIPVSGISWNMLGVPALPEKTPENEEEEEEEEAGREEEREEEDVVGETIEETEEDEEEEEEASSRASSSDCSFRTRDRSMICSTPIQSNPIQHI